MTDITFLPDEHIYLNSSGIIIPSVTQLVDFCFPQSYSDIPSYILKNKAKYGTRVHELIEQFERGEFTLKELSFMRIDPNIKSAVNQYAKVKEKSAVLQSIKSMEQIVSYEDRFAGTYDMLTNDNVLIDIKTTASLHKDWMAVQLGFYYLALGVRKDYGYCLWVPKQQPAKLVMIKPIQEEECLEILDRYEKEHYPEEV